MLLMELVGPVKGCTFCGFRDCCCFARLGLGLAFYMCSVLVGGSTMALNNIFFCIIVRGGVVMQVRGL